MGEMGFNDASHGVTEEAVVLSWWNPKLGFGEKRWWSAKVG